MVERENMKEIDFEFTRGDTCPLVFNLLDENGNEIEIENQDEIYLTFKKNYNTKDIVLQKRFSTQEIIKEDRQYKTILAQTDTANLKYGTYVFDICIKSGDYVQTIALGTMTLTNESAFINNM